MIKTSVKLRELFKYGGNGKSFNNVKIVVENGETIGNDRIVEESLKMTERMCSGDTLKFGVCEAKTLEVECINIGNLRGKKINVRVETVEGGKKVGEISYGDFTVKSCKKEAMSGRRKIIAYDAMKSSTLDADLSDIVNDGLGERGKSIYQIMKDMLGKYGIDRKEMESEKIEWITNTTGENSDSSSTSQYYAYVYSRYLRGNFDPEEYYMFDIPGRLQEERRSVIDSYLKSADLSFEGSAAFWLGQLCYLRTIDVSGTERNYLNGIEVSTEHTDIESATIFVAEKVEIRYGTEKSYSVIKRFEFGCTDVLETAKIYRKKLSEMEKTRLNRAVEKATLRNILESIYELKAEFGRMNRTTGLLESVRMNGGGLHPRESLLPSRNLYPSGGSSAAREMVEEVWIDENGSEKFGKLKINYKVADEKGDAVDAVFEYEFDPSLKDQYEVKDNWILSNTVMSEEQVEKIAKEMSENMKGIEIYPFSATIKGMPYLEAGDMIEIPDGDKVKKVYMLERTISGIHGMTDSISALGGDP